MHALCPFGGLLLFWWYSSTAVSGLFFFFFLRQVEFCTKELTYESKVSAAVYSTSNTIHEWTFLRGHFSRTIAQLSVSAKNLNACACCCAYNIHNNGIPTAVRGICSSRADPCQGACQSKSPIGRVNQQLQKRLVSWYIHLYIHTYTSTQLKKRDASACTGYM